MIGTGQLMNVEKQRKRSKYSNTYPKASKLLYNINTNRKNRVGGISQYRITSKVGIYAIGKTTVPINRVKISGKIAEAKANQDLKKLLKLANGENLLQFPSAASTALQIMKTNDKEQSTLFSTPRSIPNSIKTSSSESAGGSTQISAQSEMQCHCGKEAPYLISKFLNSKLGEIFPKKNCLDGALGYLRERYKYLISHIDFRSGIRVKLQRSTMLDAAPEIEHGNFVIEIPSPILCSPSTITENCNEQTVCNVLSSPRTRNVFDEWGDAEIFHKVGSPHEGHMYLASSDDSILTSSEMSYNLQFVQSTPRYYRYKVS